MDRAISTLSCDIAYSRSPTASRASAWLSQTRASTHFPLPPCVEEPGLLIKLDANGKPEPSATQAEHLIAKVVNLGVLDVALIGEYARYPWAYTTLP
jgi:hypothetical protein